MKMSRRLTRLGCVVLVALGLVESVDAVAECMSNNNLKCFKCNSHQDPRCKDPFNWSMTPPEEKCNGCCVKMVQGIGTPDLSVKRTCTSELRINMFMVDHVCMAQSNRKGRLCFCQDDLCNVAAAMDTSSKKIMMAITTLLTLAVAK